MNDGDGWSTFGFAPAEREVVLLGGTPLRVLRPVTLVSMELEMEHGEVEPLEFRVSLFACPECRPRTDVVGYAGHAGASCSHGRWPPRSYGPSYPVDGFRLEPGDRPSLLVYARRRTPEAESRAFVVTYLEGAERRVTRITSDRLTLRPPRRATGDMCPSSVWFGGTGNPQEELVRPLGPSPSARKT